MFLIGSRSGIAVGFHELRGVTFGKMYAVVFFGVEVKSEVRDDPPWLFLMLGRDVRKEFDSCLAVSCSLLGESKYLTV